MAFPVVGIAKQQRVSTTDCSHTSDKDDRQQRFLRHSTLVESNMRARIDGSGANPEATEFPERQGNRIVRRAVDFAGDSMTGGGIANGPVSCGQSPCVPAGAA